MSTTKPRTRDAEATRLAVFEAAERLFAEGGFAGTSMRDLSEASGVSKALIHHHFGSKESLYRAVKQRVLGRFRQEHDRIMRQTTTEEDPEAFFLAGVRSLFHFYRDNPTMVRLAGWTQLEGDQEPWPGGREIFADAAERFRAGQAAGMFREDLDASLLLISLAATAFHWWQFRAIHGKRVGRDVEPAQLDDAYLDTVMQMIRGGVVDPRFEAKNGPEGAS